VLSTSPPFIFVSWWFSLRRTCFVFRRHSVLFSRGPSPPPPPPPPPCRPPLFPPEDPQHILAIPPLGCVPLEQDYFFSYAPPAGRSEMCVSSMTRMLPFFPLCDYGRSPFAPLPFLRQVREEKYTTASKAAASGGFFALRYGELFRCLKSQIRAGWFPFLRFFHASGGSFELRFSGDGLPACRLPLVPHASGFYVRFPVSSFLEFAQALREMMPEWKGNRAHFAIVVFHSPRRACRKIFFGKSIW